MQLAVIQVAELKMCPRTGDFLSVAKGCGKVVAYIRHSATRLSF